jgi:hypothetical protein
VSRLASRIGQLERQLGGCPDCKERPVAISLHGPTDRPEAERLELCGFCGEPIPHVRVLLAFDPGTAEALR